MSCLPATSTIPSCCWACQSTTIPSCKPMGACCTSRMRRWRAPPPGSTSTPWIGQRDPGICSGACCMRESMRRAGLGGPCQPCAQTLLGRRQDVYLPRAQMHAPVHACMHACCEPNITSRHITVCCAALACAVPQAASLHWRLEWHRWRKNVVAPEVSAHTRTHGFSSLPLNRQRFGSAPCQRVIASPCFLPEPCPPVRKHVSAGHCNHAAPSGSAIQPYRGSIQPSRGSRAVPPALAHGHRGCHWTRAMPCHATSRPAWQKQHHIRPLYGHSARRRQGWLPPLVLRHMRSCLPACVLRVRACVHCAAQGPQAAVHDRGPGVGHRPHLQRHAGCVLASHPACTRATMHAHV